MYLMSMSFKYVSGQTIDMRDFGQAPRRANDFYLFKKVNKNRTIFGRKFCECENFL